MSVSSKVGSKFLFYPRSYNKRGDVSMHSMIGMTESGRLINVKLRLPEKYSDSKVAPSIVEFSRNDYRAKMPCIATDDNGPDKPEGVLLLSGCRKEGSDKNKNLDVYIARWADVICSDSESPNYFSGLSRMMIYPYSNEVIKLRSLLERAKKEGRTDDAQKLQDKIDDPASWSYPVILYYPERLQTFSFGDIDAIKAAGAQFIDEMSSRGPTGGVALRAVNSSNHVVEASYWETYSRYVVGESRHQTGSEVMDQLMERWEWIDRPEYSWEIFPIGKINSGPVANKHYSRNDNYNFVERYFYENDKPRVCHGIIRVTRNEDADLTLLSKYFALSKPIGDPAKLDAEGGLSRMFEGEEVKLAQLVDDDAIHPRADKVESITQYQPRAMWLLADKIDYDHFLHTTEVMDPVKRHLDSASDGERHKEATEPSESQNQPNTGKEETPARTSEIHPDPDSPAENTDIEEVEISFDLEDDTEESELPPEGVTDPEETEPSITATDTEDLHERSREEVLEGSVDQNSDQGNEVEDDDLTDAQNEDLIAAENSTTQPLKMPAAPAQKDTSKSGVAAFLKRGKS